MWTLDVLSFLPRLPVENRLFALLGYTAFLLAILPYPSNTCITSMGEPDSNLTSNDPKRLVSLRRDDSDFVVAFQPEDTIVFRNGDPAALRKICRLLRWKIVSDTALTVSDL